MCHACLNQALKPDIFQDKRWASIEMKLFVPDKEEDKQDSIGRGSHAMRISKSPVISRANMNRPIPVFIPGP